MMLEQLVHDPEAQWDRYAPASLAVLEQLGRSLPTLPADYLEFLALSNGGEGELGVEPGWFQLWPAEDVAALNAKYHVSEFLPGFTAFGSNGGGEMLAFGPDGAVSMVPFIPMDAAEARIIAPNFTALAWTFGRRGPAL